MKYLILTVLIANYAFADKMIKNRIAGCDVIRAIKANNEAEAIRLIEEGVDANVTDVEERSPMHWAAMQGHGEVIKHLIENNYKDQVESYDSGFFTPFNYGVIYNHANVVEILLKSGSDIDANEKISVRKKSALQQAAEIGNKQIVKLLIDNGAMIHMEDNHGLTARDIAKNRGHWSIVRMLDEAIKNPELSETKTTCLLCSQYTAENYVKECYLDQ